MFHRYVNKCGQLLLPQDLYLMEGLSYINHEGVNALPLSSPIVYDNLSKLVESIRVSFF